jgi:hypothetical protein
MSDAPFEGWLGVLAAWPDVCVSETNVDLARSGWEAALRRDLDANFRVVGSPGQVARGRPHRSWRVPQARSGTAVHMRGASAPAAPGLGGCARRRRPGRGYSEATSWREREPALLASLASFRDGKVVEMVHYEDRDDALVVAGSGNWRQTGARGSTAPHNAHATAHPRPRQYAG